MYGKFFKKTMTLRKGRNVCKGQKIFYKGEEARVIDVNPVVVIKILSKNELVCGNILKDIIPTAG